MLLEGMRIQIKSSAGDYPVWVERGCLQRAAELLAQVQGAAAPSRIFVVTSPQIDALWGETLRQSGLAIHRTLMVPAGESAKSLATLERLCEELADAGADRGSLLVALGGGVIGDLTGFLASVWMRGVPYVQVPTTLLAQVDSSVGGKTGVNLRAGKNLVGSFHPPVAVLADGDTLRTLPVREIRAGLQECIKSGILGDAALVELLETYASLMDPGAEDLPPVPAEIVERTVRVKAGIVARDEHESGDRMLLNLGHTLGHAIEAATGYTALLHGEAVGWGMIAALNLAEARQAMNAADAERLRQLILRTGRLPAFIATPEELVARTAGDKKNRGGLRKFILPTGIGSAKVVTDVDEAELLSTARGLMRMVQLQASPAAPAAQAAAAGAGA